MNQRASYYLAGQARAAYEAGRTADEFCADFPVRKEEAYRAYLQVALGPAIKLLNNDFAPSSASTSPEALEGTVSFGEGTFRWRDRTEVTR